MRLLGGDLLGGGESTESWRNGYLRFLAELVKVLMTRHLLAARSIGALRGEVPPGGC